MMLNLEAKVNKTRVQYKCESLKSGGEKESTVVSLCSNATANNIFLHNFLRCVQSVGVRKKSSRHPKFVCYRI